MKKHRTSGSKTWKELGAPQGGTIAALALSTQDELTVFMGTPVGLYRAMGSNVRSDPAWERLPEAPLGVLSLAISPSYAEDHTVVAGTDRGIWISFDTGDTWQNAQIPLASSMILSLCFSPNFQKDGILLAGTLEDGIFYSSNRGRDWSNRSFGMLDLCVYAIGISPDFARDEMVFASTETALYYSYNGARAWKELDFPEEAAPALSLAVSPDFAQDQTLLAGTDHDGLYRSADRGKHWRKVPLPAITVNALIISGNGQQITAATEAGVFLSGDGGADWQYQLDIPNAISLAAGDSLKMVGFVDQGVWATDQQADWKPLALPASRSMLGFALSSKFAEDHTAFMYGGQDGIWKTTDGGSGWQSLEETLPSLEISHLALSPEFPDAPILFAACPEGLLRSTNAGLRWQRVVEGAVKWVTFSPNGKLLCADFLEEGIRISYDLGLSWQNVSGPWEAGGSILALAVANNQTFYVALLEGIGETISIWQGDSGHFQQVLQQPAGSLPFVSFWLPPASAADRPWYASLGSQVWKFSSRKAEISSASQLFPEPALAENIISLTGIQEGKGQVLFACTGKHLYQSLDAKKWSAIQTFEQEPVVALHLSPNFMQNRTAYALLLGGAFCQGVIS